MHAVSLLIHPNWWSDDWTFSKFRFWSSSNSWRWIKSEISNKLSHVIINSGGSKAKRHAYASRDYLLHIPKWIKNYIPAYQRSADHPPFCSVTRTLICSLKKHFYEIEIILRKHLILINLINWTLYKWVIHVSRNWKLKGSPVFFIFLRRVWLYKCRVNSEKFQNFHFWAQIVIFEWKPWKL